MGQVTIYLDDETEQKMATRAQANGLSKSKWVTEAIRAQLRDEWPAAVRKLSGSWPDFPSLDELRGGHQATDLERESL